MGDDAQLQRTLDDELKPTARELAADHEAAKGRMQKVIDALSQAMQGRNAPLIERHLGTLDGLMADYAALVARGKALLARLATLRAGDERSAAGKALAALTKTLGELQGRMDRNYVRLKTLQAAAHKALAQARSAGDRLAALWADMEAYLGTNLKLFNTRRAQVEALHALARTAHAERDAKELAKIQSRNEERKSWKPTSSEIDTRLIKFFAESGKQLDPALRDQFTRDRVKFDKLAQEIEGIDRVIDQHYQAIKALAIKPIDPKKAAEAMEIPKGNEARVKKALEAGPLVDALGALAKDLKLGASGTELLARLKRAKLI